MNIAKEGKMKKVYIDRTENAECVGIFQKGAEIIPAGTTIYSMSVKDKREEYRRFAEDFDICFLFDDKLPEIDFYTVPQVDIFAADSRGGLFGTVGGITDMDGEAPVCYIDDRRNCYIIADNGKDFLNAPQDWKSGMKPAREIQFFKSREEAVKKYEFVRSWEFILNKIGEKYQEILKDKLTGIYVHGSIAFGCFRWEESDIDFIVVVNTIPSREEKEALIKALLDLDQGFPPKGVEMSVVLQKYCNSFVYPTPFELHFSNDHKEKCRQNLKEYCEGMHGSDKDLAAHFTVIRAAGKRLCGEEIGAVFGEVPREAYLDSIRWDVGDAVNRIGENPVYLILNLCRTLAYMEEDAVISKEQGGRWGIANLPEAYRPIVEKALKSYSKGRIFKEEEEKLKGFAAYMEKRMEERDTTEK